MERIGQLDEAIDKLSQTALSIKTERDMFKAQLCVLFNESTATIAKLRADNEKLHMVVDSDYLRIAKMENDKAELLAALKAVNSFALPVDWVSALIAKHESAHDPV